MSDVTDDAGVKVDYDPRHAELLSFSIARRGFLDGSQTPRKFLEQCIAVIEAREPSLRAFAALNLEGAREAADASTTRYRGGKPLSAVDGLPIGVKDLFETADMPTQMNSPYYEGWESNRDAAHVFYLRKGGALIVGKTVTTEFGIGRPGPTRNPWDTGRTPGGSSSGSGAAVGACMLPAATGTQIRGSIIRPASICGTYAIKPTFGALNRGGGHSTSPSMGHLGVLAGTLEDTWQIAHYISVTAGPDAGSPGLLGGPTLPEARRPARIARQYTTGWDMTDDASKAIFEELLGRLRDVGTEILEPSDDPDLARFEEEHQSVNEWLFDILAYEMRWPMQYYKDARPETLGENVSKRLERADAMSVEDYRSALDRRRRFRETQEALAGKVDCFLTLGHIGPGQEGFPPVGTPQFSDPSSALGAPTFALPLLAVDGLPLGVQLMGFPHGDERLAAHARWLSSVD